MQRGRSDGGSQHRAEVRVDRWFVVQGHISSHSSQNDLEENNPEPAGMVSESKLTEESHCNTACGRCGFARRAGGHARSRKTPQQQNDKSSCSMRVSASPLKVLGFVFHELHVSLQYIGCPKLD